MNPPPDSQLARLVDGLIRYRAALLAIGTLVTIVAWFPASRLAFDQSIESLYAHDDPHLQSYLESKGLFGGDELVGVVYSDPELFSDEGLARVRELAEELSNIPGVQSQSTQNLADGLAQASIPFLKKRMQQVLEFFQGILVGEDRETTAVVLRLTAEQPNAPVPRGATIAEIRRIAAAHQERYGFATYTVGEPVQVHDMFRYVQEDGRVLGWVSALLLVVVILILFRNLRWVLLPILIVQATLLWTKAILVLSGIQLSMVSSILESLVTIIGVATVMHISLVYCGMRDEFDRVSALRRTLVLLAVDVFWVCATTAGGFAAQLSSHVYPVKSFGLMMALGSMLVLVAIGVFLPGGVLLGRYAADPQITQADQHLARWLGVLGDWIENYPWRLLGVCVVVTIVSLAGMTRIRVETDFSRNFRRSSPIVQAIDFVEDNLGGAGTWEVNFPAPARLDDAYLERVRELAQKLREIELIDGEQRASLTKVVALTDGLDLIPRIPLLTANHAQQTTVLGHFQPEFLPSMYNPDQLRMRIVLRARERQPAELKERLIHEVERLAREEFPAPDPSQKARAAGLFVLLTYIIESLLGDQWSSFGWGAAGIIAMMTIAYRSLRIGLISLVPNLLPIALVIGAMGWLDLPVNIGTAMISSVSMGLTVDASIFYISAFRRMQRQGMDFSAALRATQHDIGRALIYSNIALLLGFLVLTLSHFIPLVYFGFLVSVAMLGGLAGNLVLLPLLLRATRTKAGIGN
ncbi:MAG: hypothetical protein EXS05_01905 [Planctomycetaceae bacterium]|nr:hypothetical protein [Planctomycetaceae bacterium]